MLVKEQFQNLKLCGSYETWPSLKQTAGSVVSSKPEQIAFKTAFFSNFPAITLVSNKHQISISTHIISNANLDIVDY